MTKHKLTAKQEKFVRSLALEGLSQREAYKAAYSTKNMKDTTIDSNASRLLKNSKILARYRQLLKEASNMHLWSREQAFSEYEWLKNKAKSQMAIEGIRKATSDAFLSALDGMSKMAFKDLELADEKLKMEIDKMQKELNSSDDIEEEIVSYLEVLKGAFECDDTETKE